jgi:transcriptional regulator with XRE-family HTH domain
MIGEVICPDTTNAKDIPTIVERQHVASETPSTLGERITDLRERRGWTQRKLAEAANLSATFLSEIENDRRNVGAAILLRIADVLDASLDYLLRGEAERPSPRRPVVVPPELSAAAEEESWSYSHTIALLQAREVVVARRGGPQTNDRPTPEWTRKQWIEFHTRLFGDA